MADVSDVMNALVSEIASVIYPNGTGAASVNGVTTTIYPGWPLATTLNADLQAMFSGIAANTSPTPGRLHVSVYPGNVEQNISKSIDGWQNIGTANNGVQTALKEERRIKRQFIVTIFGPTPTLRDTTASAIDSALAALRNLALPDGSYANIYYVNSMLDDVPEKEYLFRRTLNYSVEYATFAKAQATLVSEVEVNLTGGIDPTNIAAHIFNPQIHLTQGFSVGVNLSGLEDGSAVPGTMGVDYAVPTTAEMAYYKSCGLAYVRLPALWDRLQPTVLQPLNTTYLGYIQALVTYGASIGLPILLDLAHNYGGRTINGVSHKLGDGTLTNAMFADFWTRVATAFVGVPGVFGYDIMNEPSNMPNAAAWPAAAQAAVTAIRMVDAVTNIYCEGDGYSSAGSWIQTNGSLNIIDPSNKLIYSAHCYLDRDNSGTYQSWVTENATPLVAAPGIGGVHTDNVGVQRISQFVLWLQENGFKGHIGECGWGTDQNYNSALPTYNPNYVTDGWNVAGNNVLTYCREQDIAVTYWNGGPYSVGYFLGLEPSTVNGVMQQTPQMAVILKSTGATGNPAAFLSGPTRGTAGVASSPFVLDVRNYFTIPQTFTPTDNGAGGSFAPASITIPPGFNGLATFTYTGPSIAAVSKIGVTCPGGITPPAVVGYSTLTDPFAAEPASPTNILSLRLVNTAYIGPLFRAYLATDTAMANGMDVYPVSQTLSASFNQSALATWAGSTAIKILRYDQSLQGNNEVLVSTTDNQDGPLGATALAASINDLPTLVLNIGGVPSLTWSGNRTDANSPINGSTAHSWFAVAQPTTEASMQYCFGWQFVQNDVIAGDTAGDWDIPGETAVSLNVDNLTLRTYAGRYQAGATNGVQAYRDGVLTAQENSVTSSIVYQYRSNLRIGYFPFYPAYFNGTEVEIVTFNQGAIQPATLAALQASAEAYWGTPTPPGQVTGLTAGTTTPTTQPLSWTAVANATNYTVQYRVTGTTNWSTASSAVTGTSYTVTGLSSQTSYDYQVVATTGYGVGPASAYVTDSTPAYPPGPGLKIGNLGVNVSGMENVPYPITPSQAEALYYWNKGFTAIRLPFNQQNLLPTLGGSFASVYLSALDSYIAYTTGLGFKVALDCHNYGTLSSLVTVSGVVANGSNTITFTTALSAFVNGASISGSGIPSNCTITISGNTATLSANTTAAITSGAVLTISGLIGTTVSNAAFANMWSLLATHYASNPNVIFDLQNEPTDSLASTWAASCNAATAAIRAAEVVAGVAYHTIFEPFPGPNAGTASSAGSAFVDAIVDTGNNHKFECHQYNDSNGSGTSPNVVSLTVGAERLIPTTNLARQLGIQLVLGEYAVGADPLNTTTPGLECLDNELAYIQQNADVWTMAIWWAGGDFPSALAPSGYPFGIGPYNGNDTPFISHFRAYMSGGANYGYVTAAQAFPLTLTSATFAAATESAFGQALTGGFGDVTGPNAYVVGSVTLEARVTLPTNATLPSNPYIGNLGPVFVGCNSLLSVGVNTSGKPAAGGSGNVSLTSSGASIKDGNVHEIMFCSDGVTGSWLYVDGVKVATTTNVPAGRGFDTCVGSLYSQAGLEWPGTIEYVAMWSVPLHTGSTYTTRTVPPVGDENYLIGYWPFDGNGNGYA